MLLEARPWQLGKRWWPKCWLGLALIFHPNLADAAENVPHSRDVAMARPAEFLAQGSVAAPGWLLAQASTPPTDGATSAP